MSDTRDAAARGRCRSCGRTAAASLLVALLLLAEIGLGALQPWPLKVVIDYVLVQHPIPAPFASWLQTIHDGNPFVLLVTLVVAGVMLQVVNQLVSAYSTQVQVDTGPADGLRPALPAVQHLQALGLHHHITTSTGDAVYRSTSTRTRSRTW